jgi:hypothetical protein
MEPKKCGMWRGSIYVRVCLISVSVGFVAGSVYLVTQFHLLILEPISVGARGVMLVNLVTLRLNPCSLSPRREVSSAVLGTCIPRVYEQWALVDSLWTLESLLKWPELNLQSKVSKLVIQS